MDLARRRLIGEECGATGWRGRTSPTVKNDSIFTSHLSRKQFEYQDNRSSASSISAGRVATGRHTQLADRGWQKWSRGVPAILSLLHPEHSTHPMG